MLAWNRVGDNHITEVAISTITGSLRKEVECFLVDVTVRENVHRDAIPWAQVRAHVIANFLNVYEAALRDAVETKHQSTYETDASLTSNQAEEYVYN